MSNTSVHLPDDLLERLDRAARRRRVSRNRLIVEACERALEEERGAWPPGYFSERRFEKGELEALRADFGHWMRAITSTRRSVKRPPF